MLLTSNIKQVKHELGNSPKVLQNCGLDGSIVMATADQSDRVRGHVAESYGQPCENTSLTKFTWTAALR